MNILNMCVVQNKLTSGNGSVEMSAEGATSVSALLTGETYK